MPSSPNKTITIHNRLDFVCSWCYITHHNLLTALSHLQTNSPSSNPFPKTTIVHHPQYIDPLAPPFGIPGDAYMSARQGPLNSLTAHRRIDVIARDAGLELNTNGLIGHTRRAHRLVYFARTHRDGGPEREAEVVEQLFRHFWFRGGDITSIEGLAGCAANSGFEREEVVKWLQGEEGWDEVDAEVDEWVREREERKAKGVPYCVVVAYEDDTETKRIVVDESRSAQQWKSILDQAIGGIRDLGRNEDYQGC